MVLRRPLLEEVPSLTLPGAQRTPSMRLSSPHAVGSSLSLFFTLYTVRMDFCLNVCMASTTLDAPSGLYWELAPLMK